MERLKDTKRILTSKDIEDGKKLNSVFENLSDIGKAMAMSYISALRDKEASIENAG